MNIDPALLVALAALIGLIAPMLVAIATNRKYGAESTKALTDAATEMVGPLHEEIKTLRSEHAAELRDLRQRYSLLVKDNELLHQQIKTMQCTLDARDERIEQLESGVELLNHQVKALNAVPIFSLVKKPTDPTAGQVG